MEIAHVLPSNFSLTLYLFICALLYCTVLDGKLLTKAQVKDWFANICKDLEIDKEMVSQFTLMNGKGLNLLLKEDWLNRLPNLLGDLLFRMWSDLKEEQPYEQSSGTGTKKEEILGVYFTFRRSFQASFF